MPQPARCIAIRLSAGVTASSIYPTPNTQQATLLSGIAEADEKGLPRIVQRQETRADGKGTKRGLSDEQILVLICRDRAGCTDDFVLDRADKEHIAAVLKPILATDAILGTDGGRALGAAARELGIVHRPVNLARGVRVVAGVYHVQNVNAYGSRLKEWMRRFHGVATRHLPNYLGWRRLIECSHNAPPPRAALLAALEMSYAEQLTVTSP